MSNTVVNKIRKLPMDSTPKMLLWVIADIADDNGETSWFAPRSRLIEETGLSHTTIAACISYLKECGVLVVAGGTGKQNQYVVKAENFNPEIKYMPKKHAKPVSEADTETSQPSLPHQSTTLTTPVNLAEKPVSEADTIPHSIIYPSYIPQLGDSANPPNDEPEPKAKRITKKQAGVNRLVELGCEEKYAKDWMTARKGAELTESVVENLTEQAARANITIAMAVEWSAKKGYQGFKADWYLRDQQPAATSKPKTYANEWDAYFAEGDSVRDVTPKKTNEVGYARVH